MRLRHVRMDDDDGVEQSLTVWIVAGGASNPFESMESAVVWPMAVSGEGTTGRLLQAPYAPRRIRRRSSASVSVTPHHQHRHRAFII